MGRIQKKRTCCWNDLENSSAVCAWKGKGGGKCQSIDPSSSTYVCLLTSTFLPTPLHPPPKGHFCSQGTSFNIQQLLSSCLNNTQYIVLGAVEESKMNETQFHPTLEQLTQLSAEMFGDCHCSNISVSVQLVYHWSPLSLCLTQPPFLSHSFTSHLKADGG